MDEATIKQLILRAGPRLLCQVVNYMEETTIYRAKWIRANHLSITKILEHFSHKMSKWMVRGNVVLTCDKLLLFCWCALFDFFSNVFIS